MKLTEMKQFATKELLSAQHKMAIKGGTDKRADRPGGGPNNIVTPPPTGITNTTSENGNGNGNGNGNQTPP